MTMATLFSLWEPIVTDSISVGLVEGRGRRERKEGTKSKQNLSIRASVTAGPRKKKKKAKKREGQEGHPPKKKKERMHITN